MPKRYYWLKLKEDFFDREEIRIIEQMENGKDYIIFYLKLLLKSIKTDGILRFKDILPYNPKMLSVITDTNIDIVRSAIDLFTHFGMMEKWDDGTLFMVETVNMIGSESESAERMRRLRARRKQKQLVEGASQCDVDVRKSDTDIDIDIDIDIKEEEEERQFEIRKKLSAITGIDFENQTGTEAVQRWIEKYPREIIYLCAEITARYAQKPNIQYMEQVLQDWANKGWNTAAKIKDGMARAKDRKRPRPKTGSSKKYEDDAEIYVSPASLERLREATENAEDTERVFAPAPDHPLS